MTRLADPPGVPNERETHLLANLVRFVGSLRAAGLPVSTEQTLAVVQALELTGVRDRAHVFHAARGLLVTRREDLRVFDAVFARFFRAGAGTSGRRAPRESPDAAARSSPGTFTIASYQAFRSGAPEREVEDRRGTWSNLEVLRRKRFAAMTVEELAALRRVLHEAPWQAALRRSRRLVPSARGTLLDLRRAMRTSLRHGGLVLAPPRRTHRYKERPIVFLADISGSMDRYSRIALHFLHAATRSRRHVESFVFGTRLTRITHELRARNVDRAIDNASSLVTDWAGGTRIGDSLRQFNRQWAHRVLRRGAIAVVLSDGLDRGDLESLRREMRWLRDRSWRLIWLNPLTGVGFSPRAGGMAAAIGFVDDFLPAHDLYSLEAFVASLRSLPRRRSERRATVTHAPTRSASGRRRRRA